MKGLKASWRAVLIKITGNRSLVRLALLAALMIGIVILYQVASRRELTFETIEQIVTLDVFKQWQDKEPGLLIIAGPDDLAEAEQFITSEALLALSHLDFTTHLAIIAFRGWIPTGGGFVRIEHVRHQGNEISIYAQTTLNNPLGGGPAVETSPYHLIKMSKAELEKSSFTFNLFFGGIRPVTSVSHEVP